MHAGHVADDNILVLRDKAIFAYANDTSCLLLVVFKLCSLENAGYYSLYLLQGWLTLSVDKCKLLLWAMDIRHQAVCSMVPHIDHDAELDTC